MARQGDHLPAICAIESHVNTRRRRYRVVLRSPRSPRRPSPDRLRRRSRCTNACDAAGPPERRGLVQAELGCDWHTVNDAVVAYGTALLNADAERVGTVDELDSDVDDSEQLRAAAAHADRTSRGDRTGLCLVSTALTLSRSAERARSRSRAVAASNFAVRTRHVEDHHMSEDYQSHVAEIERNLQPWAFHSEKADYFLDGVEVWQYYEDEWSDSQTGSRLKNRTPLSIERDRILFSDEYRRLSDKYHVLYHKRGKTVRNYTTQVVRAAQIADSSGRALGLNPDLISAIALGSKVGAASFIHRSKTVINIWLQKKLKDEDDRVAPGKRHTASEDPSDLRLFYGNRDELPLPGWLAGLDVSVISKLSKYLPWAAGDTLESPYASGKESYLLLCTDPFRREALAKVFLPQTMYGVWRHSRNAGTQAFEHKSPLFRSPQAPGISERHGTHEASLVRFADDISWVIENINDANRAALDAGQGDAIYAELLKRLKSSDAPPQLRLAVAEQDPGLLYTYFILDLVDASLDRLNDGQHEIVDPTGRLTISLSAEATRMLDALVDFLHDAVFTHNRRLEHRNTMLDVIATTCLDMIYEPTTGAGEYLIDQKRRTLRWSEPATEQVKALLDDPLHRIQLSVDLLASLSDREVLEFAGLEAL